MITVSMETITPAKAQEYLTRNISNRRLDKRTVECYSDMMKRGLWRTSPDCIAFSEDNDLYNGQHRLNGVIKSGVNCLFAVMRGLPREDFDKIDNGKVRSAGDSLYIKNVANSNTIAAIIKRKLILDSKNTVVSVEGKGHTGGNKRLHNPIIIDEYNKRSGYYNELSKAAINLYGKNRLLTTSDYGGFIAYLNLSLNHPFETCTQFFYEFVEDEKPTNDVVSQLRRKLLYNKLSPVKMTSVALQKLIIKAWNAWITGKTVKRLSYIESTDKDLWFI